MASSEQGTLERIQEANESSSEEDIEINISSQVENGPNSAKKTINTFTLIERSPSFGDNLADKIKMSPVATPRKLDYSSVKSVFENSDFGMSVNSSVAIPFI